MSTNPVADQDLIFDAVKAAFCGGRVFDDVPEEEELESDPVSGFVLPYIILTFGAPTAQQTDRTIEGEEQQPQVMAIIGECWAASRRAARDTAGALGEFLTGMKLSDNVTEIQIRGGSWFTQRDSAGRPTRRMNSVTGVTAFNQSVAV